ncbi:hypothetical protein [Aeromonas salmonicida]|uniref:hypothetical protein n=1 Tax=Aeromonas salmonicida TaxID=645 RepID=UPI0021170D71|nr:hypothetical protein [Aeromonas salmonicida]UUI59691.1 hypothetical protein NP805_16115 [Aeromonas salmonicida]
MKLTILALAAIMQVAPAIADDASSCYNIADQDHRTACLARAHNDSGRCYAIRDSGLKAECQAETRK